MVDAVSTINNTATNSATAEARNSNTVNYDAFLQLLVAQLRHQDPTDPQDSGEFMSQLASFSSVEQQIQTNEMLTSMFEQNALSNASGLIGKTIQNPDGQTGGTVVAVTRTPEGWAAEIEDGSLIQILPGIRISNE